MLICEGCGLTEERNQLLELDLDDALAIKSMNRSAIVRISQSQTLAVSKAKTFPDTRTADELLETFQKISNIFAENLLPPLLAKYWCQLAASKGSVLADQDNILLFPRSKLNAALSHRSLAAELQAAGLSKHLHKRLSKRDILSILPCDSGTIVNNSDTRNFVRAPNYDMLLGLTESTGSFLFPRDYEKIKFNSLVVQTEERTDWFSEITHGHYRSILRMEKFPIRSVLDNAKYDLFASKVLPGASVANETDAAILTEAQGQKISWLIKKLGGSNQAYKMYENLKLKKIQVRKFHRAKFRDLVTTLTGSSVLKHGAGSFETLHKKFFMYRDAPVIGNFMWSLEKIAAAVVAGEVMMTGRIVEIKNMEISLNEYLKAGEDGRNGLLEFCQDEIFAHANVSIFGELINVLRRDDVVMRAEGHPVVIDADRSVTGPVVVPRVFWHPKKPRPKSLPEVFCRFLRFLHMQTGVSERQIHNGALRVVQAVTRSSAETTRKAKRRRTNDSRSATEQEADEIAQRSDGSDVPEDCDSSELDWL